MELYKKHRPKTLDEIVGSDHAVAVLRNMLARKRLPRTILLHGPSGCGKTTLARILKTELGCHDMDFRELNASSFRGIDSVRDIARIMNLAPVGGCRIFMFDETHKWTNDAQNAALKMLEDTPDHVYFILCTTDPKKLIEAIRTRCTEIPVRLLTHNELTKLAKRVARREKMELLDGELEDLADASQGSARRLLVLMEVLSNVPEGGDRSAAMASAGEDDENSLALCRALLKKSPWKAVAAILKNITAEPESVRWSVLMYARSVLLSGKADHQAYLMIDIFKSPFYDSKEAGLAAACFEVICAN
jgi:DNA polymerase III gamma/tau subunit